MRVVKSFALCASVMLLQAFVPGNYLFAEINPVTEFGANGKDTLDDWQAIQQAFDEAFSRSQTTQKRVRVYLPRGIYYTSKTIEIRSNVEFVGDRRATEIRPLATSNPNDPTVQTFPSPILRAQAIDGGLYRKFRINGTASTSSSPSGIVGIHLAGTSNVTIKNIETYDIGRTAKASGGTHILVSAAEPEANPLSPFGPPGIPSIGNRIENCRFLDPHYTTSFLVRLMTKWKQSKPTEELSSPVSNTTIRKNLFRGGFWNALEIAGPNTVNNSARYNTFVNPLQTALEADKGARSNTFEANRIRNARPNSIMATPETTSKSAMLMVIRDQGIPEKPGAYPERIARNNSYIRNVIVSARGVYHKTGGFMLNRSQGATFIKNRLISITIPGKTAQPAAFVFWHDVFDYKIASNRIPKKIIPFKTLND